MTTDLGAVAPIDAAEKKLQHIFHDDYEFEIPFYQRPYAWEIEQADQLLSDLFDAMDAPTGPQGIYFLGSIVLVKARGVTAAKVVDGQQRLTTLTILLAILRDLTMDQETKFEREAYIRQKGSRDRGTADRMRLTLREADQDLFRRAILDRDATNKLPSTNGLEGSQLRIIENAQTLRARLEDESESRRDDLMNFLLTKCYLVVVSVPSQDTARRIFTVLNARGLDLTPTDILKAQLLERVKDSKLQRDLAKKWEACETAVGREQFVTLFGNIRMIDEREKAREALESAFPKKVKSFSGAPADFISSTLEPYSDAFLLMQNDSDFSAEFGPEAQRCLTALKRLDNTDWHPPVLAFLVRFVDANDLGKFAASFFKKMERLSYFLFVTRADVNERIRRHAAIIEGVLKLKHPGEDISAFELSASEKADSIKALGGDVYRQTRVCKPVLLRLDEVLSNGTATYSGDVSIEHVLPQTIDPSSSWASLFPQQTDRDLWAHKLANLVLLNRRTNTAAKNWDFDKKKKQYFERKDGRNPFPLTQEVLSQKDWTMDVLTARQKRLVDLLAKHWGFA